MIVFGLVCFYDEQPADFCRTIRSLAPVVDAVCVLDGAYALWPDGKPSSPAWQVDALRDVCADADLVLHYRAPNKVWKDEITKRISLFDLAREVGCDWGLIIDADEEIVRHGAMRSMLASTDLDVASIGRDGISPFAKDRARGIEPIYESRNLMRLTPGLRLYGGHGCYLNEKGCLDNPRDLPALDLSDEVWLHHFHRFGVLHDEARVHYYANRSQCS